MDKNGTLVKRWVKPRSEDASGKIPAPMTLPVVAPPEAPLLHAIYAQMNISRTNITTSDFDHKSVKIVEDALSRFGYPKIDRYKSAIRMAFKLTYEDNDAGKTLFNNLAFFTEIAFESSSSDVVPLNVNGVKLSVPLKDFTCEAKPQEQQIALALMKASCDISSKFLDEYFASSDDSEYDFERDYIKLRSDALIELISSRPQDVDQIIRLVNDRMTDEVSIIKTLLEYEVQSLSEGVL